MLLQFKFEPEMQQFRRSTSFHDKYGYQYTTIVPLVVAVVQIQKKKKVNKMELNPDLENAILQHCI